MQGFLQFLSEIRGGRAADQAFKALQEVRDRVSETGKPGVFVLTLTIKPATKGNKLTHAIIDRITTKLPVGEVEESLAFVDENGLYTRRDPRQPEIPGIRAVTSANEGVENVG